MKTISQIPREPEANMLLDFTPPKPDPYSIVNVIMPDGSRKQLGYVMRNKCGKFYTYLAKDFKDNYICQVTTRWGDIEAGFEQYALQLLGHKRLKEISNIQQQKQEKRKGKHLER